MKNINGKIIRNTVIIVVIVLLCIKILTPFFWRPSFMYYKDENLTSHFQACNNVKKTWITNPNIYNLNCIKYCDRLESLYINTSSFNQSVDTKYIVNGNIKNTVLQFHSNDWSHLKECTNLEFLSIMNSNFSDTNNISGLSKLEELYIVTDNDLIVRNIEKSENLKRISLLSDKTVDVAGLSKLTNIEYLHIAGEIKNFNSIRSVSVLALQSCDNIEWEHMKNINGLKKVIISDCQVNEEIINDLKDKGVTVKVK